MSKHSTILLIALAGCRCGAPQVGDTHPEGDTEDTLPHDSTPDDSGPEDTGDPAHDCTEPAPLPVTAGRLTGFTQAEDFAFDGQGYLVSIDWNGTLLGINQDGDTRVILPNAGEWTSGMHMLLDGSFVYSNAATGTLMRVVEGQGAEALVSGMSYPNGIEVDLEGFVYVTEHDAGRVRRIDPATGAYSFVAQGLHHPNGIQFSSDYGTLFVNSFGGGMVHAIQRENEDSWAEPALLGFVPSIDPDTIPTPCAEANEGDSCTMIYGGIGACADEGDDALVCADDRDSLACAGLAAGDPCTTDFYGSPIDSVCVQDDDIQPDPFCPRVAVERVTSCIDKSPYANCRAGGENGYCVSTWEGLLTCSLDSDWDIIDKACAGVDYGEPCQSLNPTGPWEGTCEEMLHWGYDKLCSPWYGWGEKGGLDGMAVDACDNVYVSEYVAGEVYRFSPDGEEVELVYRSGAQWIPNMHWGNGIGGWDERTLYVLDRDWGNVHALEVDVMGVDEAYRPGITDAP